MSRDLSSPESRWAFSGWLAIGAIALLYVGLYVANYWLPLPRGNYTTRIWAWSQLALTIGALIVVIAKWRTLKLGACLLGLFLAILSALSHRLHDPSLQGSLLEAAAVWLCLLAGITLFQEAETPKIPAFQPSLATLGRSLLLGCAIAVPLTLINNFYFYLNAGEIQLQNVFTSAFAALSPAIHEEIIFRFFVLALCLKLLKIDRSRGLLMGVAILLAVVPHSLNHLPDLFLENPVMGFVMLALTSLLFGFPMALLQVKRNLETAIAFHWLIDFARFLFGY